MWQEVRMDKTNVWNPFEEWRHVTVRWIKVDISKEDLKRFNERSNWKGLVQTISFLTLIALTAALSYFAFLNQMWVLLAFGLYLHGMIYGHFGFGIHELTHNTVFKSKWLNQSIIILFGLLYWPYNPYFYKISHMQYHHRYTLFQNSDGEDTANYVDLGLKSVLLLFFGVFRFRQLVVSLARLFTLKPTSKGWRQRGYRLDLWEQFVLERANDQDRKAVHQFAVISLIFHVVFAAAAILTGHWFLLIIITLAPFYGPGFHTYLCGIHQHANCRVNEPDYRISCGDALLDPISSILYWHMEYHIEHHMFASIPCYNLKKFSRFAADQLPPKERAVPRLIKLAKQSPEVFGSYAQWREKYGWFKGI